MKIGLPKEIKNEEYRVGLTPATAREYILRGHTICVETGAGVGSGFCDSEYEKAGCVILGDAQSIYDGSEMIIKVKEPIAQEYDMLNEGQILYTYLHLAANLPLTQALLQQRVNAVAYETVVEMDGSLPLLTPMSQIAGRMAVQEGAKYLERPFGGRGILLGGVPGVPKGKVVIIGAGIAGTNACRIALGMGADVTIMDISARRLAEIEEIFGSQINTLYSNRSNIELMLEQADILIGAVLIPGAIAPKLIKRSDLKRMKPGAVIVDIAIDQGGIAETSRPTRHMDPIYVIDEVVHYCVANMPGAVALSSTLALTNATNRYGLQIADQGLESAQKNPAVKTGLNTYFGRLVNSAVAAALDLPLAS